MTTTERFEAWLLRLSSGCSWKGHCLLLETSLLRCESMLILASFLAILMFTTPLLKFICLLHRSQNLWLLLIPLVSPFQMPTSIIYSSKPSILLNWSLSLYSNWLWTIFCTSRFQDSSVNTLYRQPVNLFWREDGTWLFFHWLFLWSWRVSLWEFCRLTSWRLYASFIL